jgi:methionine synthase / methylenetetrahydrofolate reductase (NADH)
MADLLEALQSQVVLGDGAMGTLLHERGLPADQCVEAVVLSDPDRIEKIHREYIDAGARVIKTNSYGANAHKLAHHGLEKKVAEINWKSVQIAKTAAGKSGAWIAGSVGPLGLSAEEATSGAADREAIFRQQIGALLDGGVQLIFLETFHDLSELLSALYVVQSLHHCPVVCSMLYSEDGRSPDGTSIATCVEVLTKKDVHVVGANCAVGPQGMLQVISKFPYVEGVALSAFPNATRAQYFEGRYHFMAYPDYFAERGVELINLGVRLIGGCCGTTPAHIAALAKVIPAEPPTRVFSGISTVSTEVVADQVPTDVHEETILDVIKKRTLIVTELDPPKTLPLEKMFAGAKALKESGTDAVTLADNSLAIMRVSNVAVAHLIQQKVKIRPLLHLACRDRNLIGLQSELLGIHTLGMNHVLALTGDPAKTGDHPGATSVYDLNSVTLIQLMVEMNKGHTPSGRDLKASTRFVIGCSFNPNVKNLDVQLKRLERKLKAGAHYVMTQPIFDPKQAKIVRDATAAFKVPILLGVMPLLHSRNAEFLHNEVPGIVIPESVRDRMRGKEGEAGAKEGLEIAREIATEVLSQFRGIYFITPFLRYELTADLGSWVRAQEKRQKKG